MFGGVANVRAGAFEPDRRKPVKSKIFPVNFEINDDGHVVRAFAQKFVEIRCGKARPRLLRFWWADQKFAGAPLAEINLEYDPPEKPHNTVTIEYSPGAEIFGKAA